MCFSGVLAKIDFSYGENKLRAQTTWVDHYKLKLLSKNTINDFYRILQSNTTVSMQRSEHHSIYV